MKVFVIIAKYYDGLWSDPDGIFVDGVFSVEEKALLRKEQIEAEYGEDCFVYVREMTLDMVNEEQRIRIC